MNLVVLGLPGTGKGTLGKAITSASAHDRQLGGRWIEFDAGSRLREHAYAGDAADQVELRRLLEGGQLAPTEMMMRFYREWIQAQADAGMHILSSGIPRGDQTDYFLADIAAGEYTCDGLVWLDAPVDVLIRRLAGRRTCTNTECGEIYHIDNRPPANEGICDSCGSAIVGRPEDQDETTMRKRIRNNAEKMESVRAAFREAGIPVFSLDGTMDPELVFGEVRAIIRRSLQRRVTRTRARV